MSGSITDAHPSLYLLGEHLDAALAMGEDLLTCKVELAHGPIASRDMARVVRQNRDLAGFLADVRVLELSLIARLLQARKWAEEIRRRELRLKPVIQLFVAGTTPLLDAAAELGDTTSQSFETGNTAYAFLRSRGIIATDDADLHRRAEIAVTEEYLVACRARLGTLLDLVAAFLDTLDLLADLRIAEAPPVPASEGGEPSATASVPAT